VDGGVVRAGQPPRSGGSSAASAAVGKCRGYGRGVARRALSPQGGFIAGAPIEVATGGGGSTAVPGIGSPGCPWIV